MDDLPTTLSPDAAATVVALVERRRYVIAIAIGVAAGVVATWLRTRHWLAPAIAACVIFPLAVRFARSLRLRALRRRFARDPARSASELAKAWAQASPGQRAALQMLVKKSS
jgi:hypothetical protein